MKKAFNILIISLLLSGCTLYNSSTINNVSTSKESTGLYINSDQDAVKNESATNCPVQIAEDIPNNISLEDVLYEETNEFDTLDQEVSIFL